MRHRPRRVLITFGLLAASLAAACTGSVENDTARTEPSAEAREYCALVEQFYGRLDQFLARVRDELGEDADEEQLDRRFVGFIRENQELFERLAAAAPAEIAVDAATQTAAFEQAAVQGTLEPLETPQALAAEARTVEYEQKECGVVVQ